MDEVEQVKILAGIGSKLEYRPYQGSNISITAGEKRRIEKEFNISPGTPEWFQLWFSLPYLTGERPYGDNKWLR